MSNDVVLWLGLALGFAFGAVSQASGFCLQNGLRGWWRDGDPRRIRTFALAAGVAIIASQALEASGQVPLSRAIYVQSSFSVVILLIGGVLFGYGMILANGCGARALVLLGRGNLRSLVVLLVLGIAAQATLTGLLAPSRVAVTEDTATTVEPPTLPAVLAELSLGAEVARWLSVALVAGLLIVFAFAHRGFRASPGQVLAGIAMGLIVAAGWYVTGFLGADEFDPEQVASLSFIAPIAAGIQYVMLSTGTAITFGVVIIGGVLLGSLLTAVALGRFRLEGFTNPRAMLRYSAGGALMGVGGALALGCSIGQGLTGFSTLALASFVAVAGILIGSFLGIRGPISVPPPTP